MFSSSKPASVTPNIIIHGGCGNITRQNLPPDAYKAYRASLLSILDSANSRLRQPGAKAIDVATYVVSLLENDTLFNAGHGAVFTLNGTQELEASVMVSRGYRKRGVGVMKLSHVKNPILLAKEMLIRGNEDDGGGAQGHVQLAGESCEKLASDWGLELVKPSYFWTKKRWAEHRRALGKSSDDATYDRNRGAIDNGHDESTLDMGDVTITSEPFSNPTWDSKEYLPQGTVGCCVLDSEGVTCVATSTGGITNKLPGRIGDTPTIGAGFWAEEWTVSSALSSRTYNASSPLTQILSDCLPSLAGYLRLPSQSEDEVALARSSYRAVAMSGTGNGDSFLRLNAARTAAAIVRFQSQAPSSPAASSDSHTSLQASVTAVAGLNGMLQQSAEDRWRKTGEGEGGIIGLEVDGASGTSTVVADFNCGGMFRTWYDEDGKPQMMVFKKGYQV
ncbi:hypothetical protein B0A48_01498 [Cryoendolithus antarcticus]|uniref:N-terminal nucleophile aminohydrolase n=1 Tax=Cryoendolithus antarcticus TaxID=1507870 RepID=A0A1V8TPH5_9PEZI|nr:hypothetical protein B0A48_01498 [Cryoendolithus antarcticus]